ncbi:ArsR/SmtB family transcription factor [Henriciella litoralis]|uniref:ArsR/SmtB family transcription factor n=1 Tax=Henriciella litoralis TaxID=568102 RepID=UPI0009FF2E06|nr:metalloregulator ArsR/SmtB family transcription factor [Henriciella litoralis]
MIRTKMDPAQLEANATAAAAFLRALANEKRLMVLCQLVEGEKSVGELLEGAGVSQSALSQHLAKLRDEKLVKTRRAGQVIYYSIDDPAAAKLLETLADIFCPEDGQ